MINCCGDNRFKIIEKAKEDILRSTNIETDKDEMKVLDNFLFRCWQMDWLKKYETTQSPWISVKDDLPCNHEELLHPLYANFTKDVLVIYENKYISLERMIKDDKGNWKFIGDVAYWFAIPELPKE